MTRFWTFHWQFRLWRDDNNTEYETVDSSGSNSFRKRGVAVGDTVYVISLSAGQLYLGGRMTVGQITSRDDAIRLLGTDNLYEANEWIVDPERAGTPLHLHRRLSPELTKRLRFESKTGPKEPCFVSDTELDNQATRGVRELTAASAALLDRIIDCTDRLPRSEEMFTVTDELLQEGMPAISRPPTYLLTWNPAVWNGVIENSSDWSCGNNTRIKTGDRLFLIRQGIEPRGIAASGWAITDVFEDGEGTRRVTIQFDVLPDGTRVLPRALLAALNDGLTTPMNWSARISGTRIPNAVAARLESAWVEFVAGRMSPSVEFREGAPRETTHNIFERNPEARRRCLEHHGRSCAVCWMSFGLVYGPLAKGFIHVHHLRPLSEIGAGHTVNPVADLLPVCANCHAVLHLGGECRSIEDVRQLIEGQKLGGV